MFRLAPWRRQPSASRMAPAPGACPVASRKRVAGRSAAPHALESQVADERPVECADQQHAMVEALRRLVEKLRAASRHSRCKRKNENPFCAPRACASHSSKISFASATAYFGFGFGF